MKVIFNRVTNLKITVLKQPALGLIAIVAGAIAGCDGCGDDTQDVPDADTYNTDTWPDPDGSTDADTDTDTDSDTGSDSGVDTDTWECVNDEDCPSQTTICHEWYCFEHECLKRIKEEFGTECEHEEPNDNVCTTDWCNLEGDCEHIPVTGTECDDGEDNPCMEDKCLGGVCGFPIDGPNLCTYDDNPCTEDICWDGECTFILYGDGHSCDDTSWCNGNETCLAGECQPGEPNCVDPNPCKFQECFEPSGGSIEGTCGPPQGKEDGADCDDGLYCNGPDKCDADFDICVSGPWPCDYLEYGICEEPDCNEEEDLCFVKDITDNQPCPDAVLCDGTEVCMSGECEDITDPYDPYKACDRDNACEIHTCTEGIPLVDCDYDALSDESPCDPDNPCFGSGNHYCLTAGDGTSQCTHGSTPYCASDRDGNKCTEHLSCNMEDEDTVVCGLVLNKEPVQLLCNGVPLSFSTLTAYNELETYTRPASDAGPAEEMLADMTGGEVIYEIVFPGAPAGYTLTVTQDATLFGNLHMIVVTSPCEDAAGSWYADNNAESMNMVIRKPETGTTHYLIIDGQDENRGWGAVECE